MCQTGFCGNPRWWDFCSTSTILWQCAHSIPSLSKDGPPDQWLCPFVVLILHNPLAHSLDREIIVEEHDDTDCYTLILPHVECSIWSLPLTCSSNPLVDSRITSNSVASEFPRWRDRGVWRSACSVPSAGKTIILKLTVHGVFECVLRRY